MNVAICLSGAIKFIDNGLYTINKISSLYNTKLFIHSWEIEDFINFNSNTWTGQPGQLNISYGDHYLNNRFDVYKYEDILIEKYEEKQKSFKDIFNTFKFCRYDRHDLGPLSMFYSIYKANELKVKYEKNNNIKFDCVFRIRSDSLVKNNLTLDDYNINNLNIPNGRDWTGLNDQFAFASSSVMNLYSETFNNIDKIKRSIYHPETILRESIELYDINIDRPVIEVSVNNV
jgi:hypothetical protein